MQISGFLVTMLWYYSSVRVSYLRHCSIVSIVQDICEITSALNPHSTVKVVALNVTIIIEFQLLYICLQKLVSHYPPNNFMEL